MTEITDTTKITDWQIEDTIDRVRDELLKHRFEITADVAQQILGVENLGAMMLGPYYERVEALEGILFVTVKVNRVRSPQEAIDATGCVQDTDHKIVDAMPKGEGDEVDVAFFQIKTARRKGEFSDDELGNEFELRGLKPADPFSVAAVNEAYPEFANEKVHSTHWKDADGNWCHSTFFRDCNHNVRKVIIKSDNLGWRADHRWFAGVRKSVPKAK